MKSRDAEFRRYEKSRKRTKTVKKTEKGMTFISHLENDSGRVERIKRLRLYVTGLFGLKIRIILPHSFLLSSMNT